LIKVTYIISDINKASAFEWIALHLDRKKIELSFILLNPDESYLENFLLENSVNVTRIICRSKKDWPKAWFQLYLLLKKRKPEVIHCHLIQANILGLTAGWYASIPSRIYTRHHSSIHHFYYKKGIFWDRLSNYFSTKIIAISPMVKDILKDWEKVKESKIRFIPHGFLLEKFLTVEEDRIKTIESKYQLENSSPVVGVISRFTEWKGVQYIIPAFKNLLNDYPNAVLTLYNASGEFEDSIKELLKSVPASQYRLIKFENDIEAALHSMDIFIHTPIDFHFEAFGQIYIEALAAKVPSIFTLSGIAAEFIEDGKNALVVPFKNSDAIYQAMLKILKEDDLKQRLRTNGYASVVEKFSLKKMLQELENLYLN
jgi:glycosyltransferase involved in cell wall biosynthesis